VFFALVFGVQSDRNARAQKVNPRLDKIQSGYYRIKVGEMEVIALSDGTVPFAAYDYLVIQIKPRSRRCFQRQPTHSCQSDIDGSRREAALLQVKPIAQSDCFVECQSWLWTIPSDELVNNMLICAPWIRRTQGSGGLRLSSVQDRECRA